MKEESVNLGVRNNNNNNNNNGKEGRSFCHSLSMVTALAAVFIFLHNVIAMRLGMDSVSCVLVTWQFVFAWCQFAPVY